MKLLLSCLHTDQVVSIDMICTPTIDLKFIGQYNRFVVIRLYDDTEISFLFDKPYFEQYLTLI